MSYALKLQNDSINEQFLVVLRPRRLGTDWVHVTGDIFYTEFAFNYVYAVNAEDSALTADTSNAPGADKYFWEPSTKKLYINLGPESIPSNSIVVVTFQLYLATTAINWHRIPTDSTTEQVEFLPLITKVPVVTESLTDVLFGSVPIQISELGLSGVSRELDLYWHDSSFNLCDAVVFHLLDELKIPNIALLFSGYASNYTVSDSDISISIASKFDILNKSYAQPGGFSFYPPPPDALSAALLSQDQFKPVRMIYGVVDGFEMVRDAADPKKFYYANSLTSQGGETSRVVQSGSTSTVTKLDSVQGLLPGDTLWMDRASGTDEYRLVASVDYVAKTVTHIALTNGAMAASDHVKFHGIRGITITQGGERFQAFYHRDYVGFDGSGYLAGLNGVQLNDSTVPGLSTIAFEDSCYARISGKTIAVTPFVQDFAGADAEMGVFNQGAAVLLDLLAQAGVVESEIDTDSFSDLISTSTDRVTLTIPRRASDEVTTYQDLVTQLLQTLLLRLYINENGLWTVEQIAPLSTADFNIDDFDLVRDQTAFLYDYNDVVSQVIVNYNWREHEATNSDQSEGSDSVSQTSNTARYLHKINKTLTINSLHFDQDAAQVLANRMSYALGDRKSLISVQAKQRLSPANIGNSLSISRKIMPGFAYDGSTENSRLGAAVEVGRSLGKVRLTIDDQKGIQDNEGDW